MVPTYTVFNDQIVSPVANSEDFIPSDTLNPTRRDDYLKNTLAIDEVTMQNNTVNAYNKFRFFDTTILPLEKYDEYATYITDNKNGVFAKANSLAGPADDSNTDIIYTMPIAPVFQ
jgi:hypothetical protein